MPSCTACAPAARPPAHQRVCVLEQRVAQRFCQAGKRALLALQRKHLQLEGGHQRRQRGGLRQGWLYRVESVSSGCFDHCVQGGLR